MRQGNERRGESRARSSYIARVTSISRVSMGALW